MTSAIADACLESASFIPMSVVAELESVVTANLQRATRLCQSILQKAFTGQLTS